MSILKFLFQTLCAFLQIKDRKHIEQNYQSVQVWDLGCWVGQKNLSVRICDGAPSTAHSGLSCVFFFSYFLSFSFLLLFLSFQS